MNTRSIAVAVLNKFEESPQPIDLLLKRYFEKGTISPRDKRLIFEITYGVVRHKLSLDYVIDAYLDTDHLRDNMELRNVLRVGMYQILHLDRVPNHAAVNESVSLCKKSTTLKKMGGVANAVLRKVIKNSGQLPRQNENTPPLEKLSVRFSHPMWLIERWKKNLGESQVKRTLEYFNTRPDLYLRRKLRGVSKGNFEIDIAGLCEKGDTGSGYKNLFYKVIKPVFPESISVLQEGACTVQSPSSGWVIGLLDLQAGDKVLDVCAAPGGKSTLISELVGDTGAVCALDVNHQRMKLLNENILRMGLKNVFPLVADGMNIPYSGQFDKILLDVPCSGTGVMNRHPEARWTRTEHDITEIVPTQRELLKNASNYVVPGGVVVYSTCSLEPEENYEQIDNFLKEHENFKLEDASDYIPTTYTTRKGCLTILPAKHKMDGMFAARLKRVF